MKRLIGLILAAVAIVAGLTAAGNGGALTRMVFPKIELELNYSAIRCRLEPLLVIDWGDGVRSHYAPAALAIENRGLKEELDRLKDLNDTLEGYVDDLKAANAGFAAERKGGLTAIKADRDAAVREATALKIRLARLADAMYGAIRDLTEAV